MSFNRGMELTSHLANPFRSTCFSRNPKPSNWARPWLLWCPVSVAQYELRTALLQIGLLISIYKSSGCKRLVPASLLADTRIRFSVQMHDSAWLYFNLSIQKKSQIPASLSHTLFLTHTHTLSISPPISLSLSLSLSVFLTDTHSVFPTKSLSLGVSNYLATFL